MADPQSSMTLQMIVGLVAASGAAGGIVTATAALAVWGIYGPLASYDLANPKPQEFHLTVAQLLSSLVIGLSGGKILTLMAEKNAERVAKNQLATTLETIVAAKPPETSP